MKNCFSFYSTDIASTSLAKLEMSNELHKAIKQNRLIIYYQPQIDLNTNSIRGVEALVRWNHPTQGIISPAEFIPLAEEIGVIHSITKWVLRTSCLQMVEWQDAGFENLKLAVNLSPLDFQQRGLIEVIHEMLEETQFEAKLLELEVTENMSLQNTNDIFPILEGIRNLGVKIVIDDFGKDYSSLGCLRQFPIDVLKIDKSFVQNVTNNPRDAVIVKSIISMARELNIQVVAEGIETHEQLTILQAHKCNFAQGYLLSGPVPQDYIFEVLNKSVII